MEDNYTLEDLQTRLDGIFSDETCVLNIYAIVKLNDGFSIKRVSFDDDLTQQLKEYMENSIKSSNVYGEDTTLMKLSECDARRDLICKLDMEIGGELNSFVELNDNHGEVYERFDLDNDLSKLCALVIDIGNSTSQMQIYNHIYPMEILGKKKFIFRLLDNRLTKIDSPLLLINSSFQAIQVDGSIVITNMKFIEKHSGYHRIVKEKAMLSCVTLRSFGCIDNIECYEELLETDISFARKLSKISDSSPVIQKNVPHSDIIHFCKTYPSLMGKITFNADETKIVLTTKVSKDLILKVFLDDNLTSELTQAHYESHAKDNVD
jgi:hypothetical protein